MQCPIILIAMTGVCMCVYLRLVEFICFQILFDEQVGMLWSSVVVKKPWSCECHTPVSHERPFLSGAAAMLTLPYFPPSLASPSSVLSSD